MKHPIIDKILTEWSHRVHNGQPNVKNPMHLIHLRESLEHLNIHKDVIDLMMNKLYEDKQFYARSKKSGKIVPFTNKANWKNKLASGEYEKVSDEEAEQELGKQGEEPEKGGEDTKEQPPKEEPPTTKKVTKIKDNQFDKDKEGTSKEKIPIKDSLNNGSLEGIVQSQDDLQEKRDKGVAGAGGPIASQGESLYVKNINSDFNINEYKEKNREQIDIYKDKIKTKGLSANQKRTIGALGLSEEEGIEYLSTREHHAQEELRRIKEDSDSVFYKKGKKGFNGKDEPYLEWCRAALDGAIETNRVLETDTGLDTSQPHHAVQSEKEIDDDVQSHLDEMVKNSEGEDKEYYKKELVSFKKFREYHDTFVIGKDKNGRTHIVSVSNKKGDDLKDPHNNTTPAKRLAIIKERFGENVAKRVTKTIEEGIERVSDTKQSAVKRSSELIVDDELSKVCETKEMQPYVDKLNNHKGFQEWLKESRYKSDELSTDEKLRLMQDYSRMLLQNDQKPAYEPFGKIATKIGEFTRTKKFRSQYPDIDYDSSSIKECIDIKQDEKEAVSKTHKKVVQEVTEADKELGFPKDGKNGPHTQGYIDSVLDVLHFNTYIDGGDGKMIVQMGINGAQPKHIRGCLKDLSGFDGEIDTPEGRETLKTYLRERCTIDSDSGAVHIEGADGKTQLAEDTWRTAGTSQKVASGFGSDVRKCVSDKLASERKE